MRTHALEEDMTRASVRKGVEGLRAEVNPFSCTTPERLRSALRVISTLAVVGRQNATAMTYEREPKTINSVAVSLCVRDRETVGEDEYPIERKALENDTAACYQIRSEQLPLRRTAH